MSSSFDSLIMFDAGISWGMNEGFESWKGEFKQEGIEEETVKDLLGIGKERENDDDCSLFPPKKSTLLKKPTEIFYIQQFEAIVL